MEKSEIYNKISNTDLRKENLILATIVSTEFSDDDYLGEKILFSDKKEFLSSLNNNKLCKQISEKINNNIIFNKEKAETIIFKIDNKNIELFLDPIQDEPRLVIFGSGHVAQPLAKIAKITGFTVNVIDDRRGLLNRDYFPSADNLIVSEFDSYLKDYKPHSDDYIVIVTRGHKHDYTVLSEVINSSAKYIGMIGSKHKVGLTFTKLKEEKNISEKKINKIDAPIGINLGSETPSEIAVSIMSKIISVRRGLNEA